MKSIKEIGNRNPKLKAGFFSELFFWWLKDLFLLGRKHKIVENDLYDALPEDLSEPLGNEFERSWNYELKNATENGRKPKLWKAIVRTYRLKFVILSILLFIHSMAMIAIPIVQQQLLWHFYPSSMISEVEGYLCASTMVCLIFMQTFMFNHAFARLSQLGMKVRIACTSLIFKKIIRLSCYSSSGSTSGNIMNLMSNDVSKFEYLAFTMPFLVTVPLELIAATYVLWTYIGYAAIVGVGLMLLQSLPIQIVTYRLTLKFRSKLTIRMDQRISTISEVIRGIRAIKMFVWENAFEKLIFHYRRLEIKMQIKLWIIIAMVCALGIFAHRFAVFVSVLIYVMNSQVTSSIIVILVVQYMFHLRTLLIFNFANGLRAMADVKVSIKRIEDFLLLSEMESRVQSNIINRNDVAILIRNVSASWQSDLAKKNLDDIQIDVKRNKLYVVIGSVGSGKSTLLKLLLGEVRAISGEIHVIGTTSYASQEPWLFAASVKDNILFGQKYNEKKYKKVTEACALLDDFNKLPCADRTLVAERGSNLSGGQCARVNLARAVYRDADIYLFDDPLSAVDTHVARRLFEDCISGLLKDKTRILVTHNLQFLEKADTIVLLDNGRVEFTGSYLEFKKIRKYELILPDNAKKENPITEEDKAMKNEIGIGICNNVNQNNREDVEDPKETEELLAKGYVEKSIYWRYIRSSGSLCSLFTLIFSFVLSTIFISAFDYFLVMWTKQREAIEYASLKNETVINDNSAMTSHFEKYLYICGPLIAGVILMAIAKNTLYFRAIVNANEKVHNNMFASVMKTPLRFFDVNQSGRILNRFTSDTGAMDDVMPRTSFDAIDNVLTCIAVLLPALIVNWLNIIPTLFATYLFFEVGSIYFATSQAIKRLESNAKSPLLSLAASSLAGLLTIRSCGCQNLVTKIFNHRQDRHTSAFYLVLTTSVAFSICLEIIVHSLWIFAAFSSLALKHTMNTTASNVGLALMQLRSIVFISQYFMRQAGETINLMTNIERMFQFVDLEKEIDSEIHISVKPHNEWPDRGELQFDKLYLKYTEDSEPVLKNINLTIAAGMKVGIVGRTGAGKSSLIAALFRLAKIEGTLTIDGIDTKTVNLSDLRSRIPIIPQEPVLFSASVRDNLDPNHKFDDASLWSALKKVDLNKIFDSLDHGIGRGGSDLSTGQRQLFCLARAIVQRSKILVLDEATANVDSATDEFIQKIIRIVFKDCTVLTIAHRLNTIIDSDRVLVMDHGEVVEFDRPDVLLQRNNGYFSKMIRQRKQTT